jgi:hypothetical protein
MSKFAIVASLAIFAIGALVGRATTPMPVLASEAQVATISTYELTQKAGPLPVQVADAI